jgi:hypothetical protein
MVIEKEGKPIATLWKRLPKIILQETFGRSQFLEEKH